MPDCTVNISLPISGYQPPSETNPIRIQTLLNQIEHGSAESKTAYAILNRYFGFPESTNAKSVFAAKVPARLIERNRQVVLDLKNQIDERKRAQQGFISSVCSEIFTPLKEYFLEVNLAYKMTGSENGNLKRLGWEVAILKTLGYTPFVTGMIGAAAFAACAIALPFFATSIGIIGVGALANGMGYLVGCALIDLSLGLVHKFYIDIMWEEELEDFQIFFDDYLLERFLQHHLSKGFETLQGKVLPETYNDLKFALTNL